MKVGRRKRRTYQLLSLVRTRDPRFAFTGSTQRV